MALVRWRRRAHPRPRRYGGAAKRRRRRGRRGHHLRLRSRARRARRGRGGGARRGRARPSVTRHASGAVAVAHARLRGHAYPCAAAQLRRHRARPAADAVAAAVHAPRSARWAGTPRRRVFGSVVRRTLRCGTTTATLARCMRRRAARSCEAEAAGQRALAGKGPMDRNGGGGGRDGEGAYELPTQRNLEETEAFIKGASTPRARS